ncbi:hypothetical protein [Neomoorella humiferrea]|uniref:hypothetical protein n=1 Tax=Neomoorella humiferrea TaxID=676965 RepID=UPI0014745A63|nr:hypothetical protein [Moorella humiferrea]
MRKPYGGTCSCGFKRGILVKHPNYDLCSIGCHLNGRLSLYDRKTAKGSPKTEGRKTA